VKDALLFSCEHGGNEIPPAYDHLFATREDRVLLDSHRGYDAGALLLAWELASRWGVPLAFSTVSRLLVDLNRSLGHRHLHSPAIRKLPFRERQGIIAAHYAPYRLQTEQWIREMVEGGHRVVHLSIHSFTPELHGEVRNADIGLLYLPSRIAEVDFCLRWQRGLKQYAPEIRVRRNYPYAGRNDGFTTSLRKTFPAHVYMGIELEVNQ
jgi:predicted N-formylglutamate amidohydrolase